MKTLRYRFEVPDYYNSETTELQEKLKELGFYMHYEDAYLAWKDFSDGYCASWLHTSPELIEQFLRWID